MQQAALDLGTDKYGFGYGGTGKKSNSRQFDDYGTAYGLNDVIGCALDLDNKTVTFHKNGVDLEKAFDIPPEFRNKPFFPAVCLKVRTAIRNPWHYLSNEFLLQNAEIGFNFGEQPFKFGPPLGYIPISKAHAECTSQNLNSDSPSSSKLTLKPNAPMAVIIEVR